MLDHCYFTLDVTESDPCGWWLHIGWNKNPDGTMEEEYIFFPVTDEELDTYTLTEESWE